MSFKPTITIIGANGILGAHTLRAILSEPFINSYALPIRVVTRDLPKISATLGNPREGTLKAYLANVETGDGLDAAFEGADVIINLLGIKFTHNKVADVAASSGVKVYIPSEYSTYINGTGLFKNLYKFKIDALAYARSKGLNAISVATGNFLEWLLVTPVFGMNVPEKGKLLYYGDADTKITSTSLVDVGKTLASLAAKDLATIPQEVVVGGDTFTIGELKEAYEEATGTKLELVEKPLAEIREEGLNIVANGPKSVADFGTGLRAVIATSHATYDAKNNEYVSKDLFKFSTLNEVAQATLRK